MRVEVSTKGKDITIELADGLSIKPNATTNIDDHSSTIDISDEGGAVTLVSDSGSNIYFGGYLSAPAICKSGTSTQLVFETKDSSDPDTITAEASSGSLSAGIGTAPCSIGSATTGNIVFNSGIVIAKGDGPGAGIGGSEHVNASNITINGGTVIATGGSDGAGIGSGTEGNTSGITINDGTVTATSNGNGAGIGGGYRSIADNIVISGGTVTATSKKEGCGIGTGLLIETEATSDEVADQLDSNSGTNIMISGGKVLATDKVGIGKQSVENDGGATGRDRRIAHR